MKVNGEKYYSPFEKWIVIPRGTVEEHIAFKARSVDCLEEFESLCPRPEPMTITKPGGEKILDKKDKEYSKLINEWAVKQIDFICICSLILPEGWEWDNVDQLDPSTWENWKDELKESGFSDGEIAIILSDIMLVNSMNTEAIKEAEKDFLALQRLQASNQSDQITEQTST